MKPLGPRQSIVLDAIAIAGCGAGLVPILLFSFSETSPAAAAVTEQAKIGVLERRLEDVRRRADAALIWNEIAMGDDVREGDAIYVGTDSAAQVTLDDGGRIDIDENSLVVVELAQESTTEAPLMSIAVLRGGAAPTAGKKRLSLRVGGSDVALSRGSQARVRVSQKRGASVAVTHGSADLTTAKGERTALKKGQRGTAEGKVAQLELELTTPVANEKRFFTGESAAVSFAWKPLPGGNPYLFELSNDGDFSNIVARGESKVPAWTQEGLAPGVFFWRVRRKMSKGEQLSDERKLVLRRDRAPVPYAPAAGADVDRTGGKPIALAWSALDGVAIYELELAAGDDFTKPLVTTRSQRARFRLTRELDEERYCYRVRGTEAGRKAWSAPRCFRVVLRPVLNAPEPLEHHRETVPGRKRKKPKGTWLYYLIGSVAHAAPGDSAIVLPWKKIPGAIAYRVEIAEDKEFRKVVVSERVETNFFRWRTVTRRVYYWRVRGIDGTGREGTASAPIRIEAEVSSPVLVEPRDKRSFAYTKSPPKVNLRWRESEVLKEYLVEISSDASFAPAKTSRVSLATGSHVYTGKTLGTYFWRVTGVDLTGKRTPASPVRSFQVFAAAPGIVAPSAETSVVRQSDSLVVPLEWTWRPVKGYEVQASVDPTFNEGVKKLVVKKGFAVELDPPGFGLIHWRVRGATPRTGWSEAATFKVMPAVPTPTSPEEGVVIQYDGESTAVELQYGVVPGVNTYEIELAKEWTDAEEPMQVRRVEGDRTSFENLTAGKYVWSVRAAPGELQTDVSAPRSFELEAAAEVVVATKGDPEQKPPEVIIKPEPEPAADPVLHLGPRVGFLVNLGAIVAPRFGATLSYRLPILDGAVAGTLSVDYYVATARIDDTATSLSFASELHSVPIELVGSYTFETPLVDISVGAGVALVFSYISVSSDLYETLGQVTVDGGAVIMTEAAMTLGPGRAFVALSFALTSWNGGSLGENNPGGFTMAAGYRFGLL